MTDKTFLQQTKELVKQLTVPVEVKTITAGKFRRYMDMALWKQVLRPDIGGRNLVDVFKVAGGVAQSFALLKKAKPDVVFAKGGYVSLPVGYAAQVLRVPLVIHDSDARPGLTNRVLSRWATKIATGTPVKNYRYNKEITVYTGVPVRDEFYPYSTAEQRAAKVELGFDADRPLVVATGGGLGAKEINYAVPAIASQLLDAGSSLYHITGREPYERVSGEALKDDRYKVVPFVYDGLSRVYGAADVVVTRASATTLQELASSAKATVAIPNSSLGDQIENAKLYEKEGAARMLTDEILMDKPEELLSVIETLLQKDDEREKLASKLASYSRPDAARDVARIILEVKKQGRKK